MTDLSSLIARLEKAEGPCLELDAHIRLALLVSNDAAYVAQSPFNGAWLIYAGEHNGRPRLYENRDRTIPTDLWRAEYTRSIDAAVSLAERLLPGWMWGVTQGDDGDDAAEFQGNIWPGTQPFPAHLEKYGYHRFPAIALVLATLRALQQKGSSNG